MKPVTARKMRHFLLMIFLASVAGTVFAQVGSATIEDIERLAHEKRMQKLANVPLKGFFLLCAQGEKNDVAKALREGADPNAGDPEHGGTPPLTLAAGNNPDPAVITLLLDAGAEINHIGRNYRRTALLQAILYNKNALPVVKALLKGKPDLYVMDVRGQTALDYAIAGRIGRNRVFDGIPREDIMLALLEAAVKLPFTLDSMDRQTFYTRKLRLYAAAFENGRNGGKMNAGVLAAFKKAGADMNAVKPG